MKPSGPRRSGGGCSRKVDRSTLDDVLRPILPSLHRIPRTSAIQRRTDFGDACELRLEEPVDTLVTSIDSLYEFTDDPKAFGYIAGTHALSDLFAGLAQPIFATVALGLKPARQTIDASAMLEGLGAALDRDGAVLAGGHTYSVDEPIIVVSATGRTRLGSPDGTPRAGDVIILSKPLGTGLALAARALGVKSEVELALEFASMRESNAGAAERLFRAQCRAPGAVRTVTDVSGFGFLDALRSISGEAEVVIESSQVPHFPLSEPLVSSQAWSGLADANLAKSIDYADYRGGADRAGFMPALLNDPQTSGGLLAIVAPEALADLRPGAYAASLPRVVGYVSKPHGGPRVVVSGEADGVAPES
jgi:selenide, water dikinase